MHFLVLFKRLFLIYSLLLVTCVALLVLVCTIPSSALKQNISTTLKILEKEGTYPSVGIPGRRITLDNFTDSLMLNTAYSADSHNPLKSALTNVRIEGELDSVNQISNLEIAYKGEPGRIVGYERYWHGYLVYLRPLLLLGPIGVIHIVISLALWGSLLVFASTSWTRLGKKFTLAFILGLLAVDFPFIGQSMQFSSVFLIGLLGATYLVRARLRDESLFTLFFIVGALTSFFDLLTAPIVGLGMILLVAMQLKRKTVKEIIQLCIMWAIGYLLLWSSKWVLMSILHTPSAITNAINQILDRTVTQADSNFSHVAAVKLNILQLIGYDKMSKIFVLASSILAGIIFIRYRLVTSSRVRAALPWLFVSIIPYCWYLIAANHSYLHVWYTYRDQFLSVAALLLVYIQLLDWQRIRSEFTLKRSNKRNNKV